MSADCLIIGGGLVGLLAARELARGGLRVRVVDRQRFGRAASWAGGGILSPLRPWDAPDAVTRLAAWSQAAYPSLVRALRDEGGVDAEWTRGGMLVLDPDPQEAARAEAWAAARAVPLERLGGRAVAAREPACRPAGGALWLPKVAQVRNPRLLQAAKGALRATPGVILTEGRPVAGLSWEGGRILGVREAGGELLRARRVVVTAGAWSAPLLAPLGLTLPVRPVRGEMLLFRTAPGRVRAVVQDGGRYAVPRRDGLLLFGSTLDEVGYDDGTTVIGRETLCQAAVRLLPELVGQAPVAHWAGLRPGAPDGIPFIGPVPGVNGLFVAAGHYRNGVLLAAGTARLLADQVLGRVPILDPGPFRLPPPA